MKGGAGRGARGRVASPLAHDKGYYHSYCGANAPKGTFRSYQLSEPQPRGAVTRRAVAQRRSRAGGLTRPSAAAIRGFGLGFVVSPLARPTVVCRKSFIFSSLPIRKVLVLPFRGGVSPSLGFFLFCFQRVIHSRSRSYYLFFTTCSLTTCYGGPEWTDLRGRGGPEWTDLRNNRGSRMDVENSIESHKPVEIGDLLAPNNAVAGRILGVQPDAQRPLTGR